jgi:hypothetical protein
MNGFALTQNAHGALCFSDATHRDEPVSVTPAFPASDPEHWWSLRKSDGAELALIERPDLLPSDQRAILTLHLASWHFAPVIERIESIASSPQGLLAAVHTNRGPSTLLLDGDDHIRRISRDRLVLIDKHGIRYLIPEVSALDRASRQRLERFY